MPYSNGLVNNPSYPPRTRLTFELARNEEGLWHPLTYSARFAPFRSELLFHDFRRFTSESTLVFGEVRQR